MKYIYVVICVIILLLIACVPEETPEEPQQPVQPEEQPTIEEPAEETQEEPEEEPEEEIHYDDDEDEGVELEEEAQEIEPDVESTELTEEEEMQQILNLAETKIKSYSYKYKSPSGRQYLIYVKENKIKIDLLSDDNRIYIDTEAKTAEEWCISYTKCGRQTGKIADLDYYNAYIETPIDWIPKITESKKIDDGFYYGRQSWKLDTNLGAVIIDSKFGFISSIKGEDKEYLFTDAAINTVKDSDVNVPEYLLEE